MNMVKLSILVALSLFLPISGYADDSVTIRYLEGYPVPGVSSEWGSLKISRSSAMPGIAGKQKRDVDVFFEEVASILASSKITKNWQLAIPDAPSIEITIEIDNQKSRLVSCHIPLERNGKTLVTEHGAVALSGNDRNALLMKESEGFRRNRAAFEKILTLTLERARARLSP
jgi:hypothetical protein